jgi:hypothetical protein
VPQLPSASPSAFESQHPASGASRFRRAFGMDFSGAVDAGSKLWSAGGPFTESALQICELNPAARLPGGSPSLGPALAAVRDLVAAHPDAAFGCDFPFGLPHGLVPDPDWATFVGGFGERYARADDFRRECGSATKTLRETLGTQSKELRRVTDREAHTPFSPCNLRLYRQTYHGIRDLLAPLIADGRATVAPMQDLSATGAVLLEVCPASLIKRVVPAWPDLRHPYKGKTSEHRAARERLLFWLEKRGVRIADPTRRTTVVANAGGDALDAIIAAFVTWQVLISREGLARPARSEYRMEGYVYCPEI